MKAIGYTRVSTEEQAKEGLSLENQKEKIKAFAFAKDWSLIDVVEEKGKSAKNLKRPGIQRIIAGCKKQELDVVVIYKLDRLTRSTRDLGYLVQDVFEANGIAFASIMEVVTQEDEPKNATQELVEDMLAIVTSFSARLYGQRSQQFKKKVKKLIQECAKAI